MPGTLFVVATPIGNLEDITLRALRVLREADVIAAEDTRRTAKLLSHHAISTPTLSFHEHNTRSRIPQLLARLGRGDTVALVTDAGTPGISDPGVELVRACVEAGLPIDVIPGPSAPLVAALASGFPVEPLTIFGFPPTRAKDRTSFFSSIAAVSHTSTFFEAPHRIRQTLTEVGLYLGDRPITVARELTKVHQEFIRGTAASIIGRLPEQRGEFTVVVGPKTADESLPVGPSDAEVVAEFWRSTETRGSTRRAAVSALAKKYGRTSREVYGLIEQAKKSG